MRTRYLSQAELAVLRGMYGESPVPDVVLEVADRAKELYHQVSAVNLNKVELVTIAAIAERLPQRVAAAEADDETAGAGDGSGEADENDPPPVAEAAVDGPQTEKISRRNRK